MRLTRWLTEYTASDGGRCMGPVILAESPETAAAFVVACVRGPEGEMLDLAGEALDVRLTAGLEAAEALLARQRGD